MKSKKYFTLKASLKRVQKNQGWKSDAPALAITLGKILKDSTILEYLSHADNCLAEGSQTLIGLERIFQASLIDYIKLESGQH